MQRVRIRRLVFGALLTALAVVLKSFLSIPVSMFGGLIKDINFSASIVMYAGIALGPVYGAIVGALTDILCTIIRPMGAYMPLFTLTNALMGILPALFFLKQHRHTFWKTLLSVATAQTCMLFLFQYAHPHHDGHAEQRRLVSLNQRLFADSCTFGADLRAFKIHKEIPCSRPCPASAPAK